MANEELLDQQRKELESLAFGVSFYNAMAVILLVLAVVLVITLFVFPPTSLLGVGGFFIGIGVSLNSSAFARVMSSMMKSEIEIRQTISDQTGSNSVSSENLGRRENNPSNRTGNRKNINTGLPHATVDSCEIELVPTKNKTST